MHFVFYGNNSSINTARLRGRGSVLFNELANVEFTELWWEESYMFSLHSLRDSQKKLWLIWRKGKQNQSIFWLALESSLCGWLQATSQPQANSFNDSPFKSPSIWLLKTSEADWSCFIMGAENRITHSQWGPAGMHGTKLEKHDIWLNWLTRRDGQTCPDFCELEIDTRIIFYFHIYLLSVAWTLYSMIGTYTCFFWEKDWVFSFQNQLLPSWCAAWMLGPVRQKPAHR